MINEIVVYLRDETKCVLVPCEKGFILLNSKTSKKMSFNMEDIGVIALKGEDNEKVLS